MLIDVPAPLQAYGAWFSDTPGVPTATTVVHLVAMLWSGGLAIAADRAMLRARADDAGARTAVVREVEGTHRAVIAGLAAVALSGVAMTLSELETFLASPAFWVKMGLVAVLLGNGVAMRRVEGRAVGDVRAFARLRRHGLVSLACWLLLVVAGIVVSDFS